MFWEILSIAALGVFASFWLVMLVLRKGAG